MIVSWILSFIAAFAGGQEISGNLRLNQGSEPGIEIRLAWKLQKLAR